MATDNPAWRVIARLIVGLFLLRAIVPAGFMPDLSALADGRLTVVVCTASGPQTIELDANTEPANETPAIPSAGDFCPFGFTTQQALAVLASVVEVAIPHAADTPAITTSSGSRADAVGPPLGSRAPPSPPRA